VRKPQAGRSNSGEPFRPRGGDLRHAKSWASFSRGRGTLGTNAGELDRAKSRERVKLSEMRRGVCAGHWRGSKKGAGRVGGCCGREIRRRAGVRTRRSTASTEGAELTGQAHGAERRKGVRGATAR
jgi:hypothetical protein